MPAFFQFQPWRTHHEKPSPESPSVPWTFRFGRQRNVVGLGSFVSCPAAVKRTATDQVTLGKTGLKLSRLGFGTGSNSGNIQYALGQEGFNSLNHYAYDQGITYFDCAQSYRTFEWIAAAVKGLPREKIFLHSKIGGKPEKILEAIDHHRKVFDTDYVDSLLIHCMVKDGWTDDYKRIMDAFDEAKDKKWIRAKGVSCHSLPALRALDDVEGHSLAFLQCAEAIRLDGSVMNEYIVSIGAADKAETLCIVKPLHCSLFHLLVPYSCCYLMYR